MKMLKKLALVSAVSMISAGAFAMEAMDDASMAETTGQDGITVKIKPPTSNFDALSGTSYFGGTGGLAGVLAIDNVYIHDKGGLAAGSGGTDTSGAITLTGLKMAGSAPIQLDIDADGGAAGAAPTLNVKVTLPGTFIVRTGDIGVAGSNRAVGAVTTDRGLVAASNVVILNSIDLSLGGTIMNIQLANSPQGAMIKVDGTVTNGLQISGLQLNDTDGVVGNLATAAGFGSGQGSVYIDKITVTDTGAANLTLATDIDISDFGLIMKMRAGSPAMDILMEDVRLGATGTASTNASIGDVEIVGMNMAGTQIAVSGH
jgi:hypothetical protein